MLLAPVKLYSLIPIGLLISLNEYSASILSFLRHNKIPTVFYSFFTVKYSGLHLFDLCFDKPVMSPR